MARSKYKGDDNLTDEHDNAARLILELRQELVLQGKGQEKLLDEFLNHNFVENGTKPFRLLSMILHPDKSPADKKEEYAKYMAAVSMVKEQGSAYTTKYIQNGIREMVQDPKISQALLKVQTQEQENKQEDSPAPSSPSQSKSSDLREKMGNIHQHHAAPSHAHKKEEMPVFTGILFKNLQQEYKTAAKAANFAQSAKSNKSVRAKQTDYVDEIRQALQTDRKNNTMSEKDEAQVLYAALALLEKDLKNEFRWTKWLGTQSRLESIVKKDMKALQKEFPKIADGAQQKLVEFGAKHPNLKIHEHFPEIKTKSAKNK